MSDYTNFDLLLYTATEQYCREMADEIMDIPTDNTVTDRERRRFARILRRSGMRKTYQWSPLRIAVAAVLVCMSVSFTACICIPTIRSAIKKVFVEWYHEYISVDFQDSDETEALETETVLPPTTIEQKAYIADLPEGYEAVVDADMTTFYCLSYYLDGEYEFMLTQTIIESGTLWVDSNDQLLEHITINGYSAVLVNENTAEGSLYNVVWQDGQYQYDLSGKFDNKEIAIGWAKKVLLG